MIKWGGLGIFLVKDLIAHCMKLGHSRRGSQPSLARLRLVPIAAVSEVKDELLVKQEQRNPL